MRKERKGFEGQSNYDSDDDDDDDAHARANEGHPQAGEEVSKNTDINLPERIAFVEECLGNVQETYSITERTGEVKQLVGSEVKLTVKTDEQEYNNAGK